ncbi:hypothetical protein EV361DRAFT_866430 [Lentinula raphanica]|nr:hypothetical protein EV361DRAFT_866430 [Lentinula raphanica]
MISTNHISSLADSKSDVRMKPDPNAPNVESSLEAQADCFLAKHFIDNDKVRLPQPKAFIYASLDFLALDEAGMAIHNRVVQNMNVGGKGCHTAAGTFYTPVQPVPDTNNYAYKEWFVIGQGKDSDALHQQK